MSALAPWQQPCCDDLRARVREDRLGHGLLLCGLPGLGKYAVLEAFVSGLLCESPGAGGAPCGGCRGCSQHLAGSHPNCMVLSPDPAARPALAQYPAQASQKPGRSRQWITVDQVRELVEFARSSAHYLQPKVAVLQAAERLNESAANALLKVLEEPPGAIYLILVSGRPGRLLPTLRSRCQRFELRPPPRAQSLDWLARECELPTGEAQALLDLAGHAPGLVSRLAEAGVGTLRERLDEILDGVRAHRLDPLVIAGELEQVEPVWLDRVLQKVLLERLRRATQPAPDATLPSDRLEWRGLLAALDAVQDWRRLEAHQLNRRLLLEDFLIDWQRGSVVSAGSTMHGR